MNEVKTIKTVSAIVGAIVVLVIAFFAFTIRVDAGYGCVVKNFGKPVNEEGSGLHGRIPFKTKYDCLNTRKQVYELVNGDPNQSDSKADFVDWAIAIKTVDGLDAVQPLTVQYHVPLENVRKVYMNNARNDERVKEQIVKFHVRAVVTQTLNTYTADQLYLGNLRPMSDTIAEELRTRFEAQGVVLDYFELKRGDFVDAYEQAITDKALKVEEAKKKALEQQVAEAEAERQRIQAEGDKAAAIIAAEAEAEKVKIAAQADAEKVEIAAAAEAHAINLKGQAYANNPSLLDYERIQAIRDANVIYLPSDSGVIPIMNVGATPTT